MRDNSRIIIIFTIYELITKFCKNAKKIKTIVTKMVINEMNEQSKIIFQPQNMFLLWNAHKSKRFGAN